MKYQDRQLVEAGDVVRLWQGCEGVIVCSLDDDRFADDYPRDEWGYLERGILIASANGELVHYPEPNEDLELIRRKGA